MERTGDSLWMGRDGMEQVVTIYSGEYWRLSVNGKRWDGTGCNNLVERTSESLWMGMLRTLILSFVWLFILL